MNNSNDSINCIKPPAFASRLSIYQPDMNNSNNSINCINKPPVFATSPESLLNVNKMPVQQTIDTSKLSSASAQDAATQSRRSSKSPSPSGEPDATTAVPSQMREHLGPPQITHEYPQDSTHRRHSSVSAQQAHFMK
ncbi:hypothetical protein IF1G_00128 [Cordyceps javanica]|uniref:Uncharacterized protein n=1 Tax=Cordyceps javanica TaxID=43265 RepID=A0A545WBP1_9HYPO|nr:hypothetical protein IF1G_00128 [Cordyceps javanica]TQW11399.1 hypothetical protein IF2G_00130 [Cordyceps javanica]